MISDDGKWMLYWAHIDKVNELKEVIRKLKLSNSRLKSANTKLKEKNYGRV